MDRPPTPKMAPPTDATPIVALVNVETQDRFDLADEPGLSIQIGRSRECEVQLLDTHASFIHCSVERDATGDYELTDLGSTNGTLVNGVLLQDDTVPLHVGMWITIGATCLVAVGPDGRVPILATSTTSLMARAADVYGSGRKAAKQLKKSEATVRRARKRKRKRDREDEAG